MSVHFWLIGNLLQDICHLLFKMWYCFYFWQFVTRYLLPFLLHDFFVICCLTCDIVTSSIAALYHFWLIGNLLQDICYVSFVFLAFMTNLAWSNVFNQASTNLLINFLWPSLRTHLFSWYCFCLYLFWPNWQFNNCF